MGRKWSNIPWLLGAVLLSLIPAAAPAQTISPVIVEYREKARGSFQIKNDSYYPLAVVLEPRSFDANVEGKPTYRALDPEIKLELSAKSFRIGAQQTYTVFYRASAEIVPAWFTIYATITGPTTPTGIKLVLELPHTVYLLGKKPLARDAIFLHRAEVKGPSGAPGQARDKLKRQIEAEVENRGREFGRVLEVEVTSASGRKAYAGFPFFPGQRRMMLLDWDQAGEPERLVMKFARFKAEFHIRSAPATP